MGCKVIPASLVSTKHSTKVGMGSDHGESDIYLVRVFGAMLAAAEISLVTHELQPLFSTAATWMVTEHR